MNFTKVYKINMNSLEIHFYLCIEAQSLPDDSDFKEDENL